MLRSRVNADTATQVFSPYSGRVIKVLAGVGDKVRSGEALVTVDASENLDAQSALITALSQARLAALNETRRHAAYDSHGGSLQDWQQAQADLTAAQITLSAARGKLRVLGSNRCPDPGAGDCGQCQRHGIHCFTAQRPW